MSYGITDLYVEEWTEEEIISLTEESYLGRTAYKIASDPVLSKKIRIDPNVPLFDREINAEYGYCY
jgi:hypothetical protein